MVQLQRFVSAYLYIAEDMQHEGLGNMAELFRVDCSREILIRFWKRQKRIDVSDKKFLAVYKWECRDKYCGEPVFKYNMLHIVTLSE